ncbi:hypothetical protein DSCO28_53940 [Desulfosarcina ovata subsp. sediminis]|uniref:Uncharacterized protein n=1 Tax=Desulfosarcina ovata subsp. sediminis TaxID=885957 RepID=A0A5K7ZX79_9BACT|nr:hypothetical protein DSCO28_53940 [Desulfosarcina ovata subsp. sediminis]
MIFCLFSVDLPAQDEQERAGKSQAPGHGEKKSSKKKNFNPEQVSVISAGISKEEEVVTEESVCVQKANNGNEQASNRGGSSGGKRTVFRK